MASVGQVSKGWGQRAAAAQTLGSSTDGGQGAAAEERQGKKQGEQQGKQGKGRERGGAQRTTFFCATCGTKEKLWSCLLCGFVGCGRYEGERSERF